MTRIFKLASFLVVPAALAALSACGPLGGGDICQPQGACPNLGEVTYDNCCDIGGNCRFVFPDGHEIPYDSQSLDDTTRALEEAVAHCTGEDQGDAGPNG